MEVNKSCRLFLIFVAFISFGKAFELKPQLLSIVDGVGENKHFVLVHGAGHGAWCWYKLATLLRSAGHRVTALDLSASGINPRQVSDLRSFSDYSQPLMTFMDSLPTSIVEKVILVAHSYGGLSVSKAMESYPGKVSVAVFAASVMPGPELPVATLLQEFRRQLGRSIAESSSNEGASVMLSDLYKLSPPEDLTLATMLVRPTSTFSDEDMSKEIVLTKERHGSVKRAYIMSEDDKALSSDFQLWMIDRNPANKVFEINGSDHMLMLSKPYELFTCLVEIAANI